MGSKCGVEEDCVTARKSATRRVGRYRNLVGSLQCWPDKWQVKDGLGVEFYMAVQRMQRRGPMVWRAGIDDESTLATNGL